MMDDWNMNAEDYAREQADYLSLTDPEPEDEEADPQEIGGEGGNGS